MIDSSRKARGKSERKRGTTKTRCRQGSRFLSNFTLCPFDHLYFSNWSFKLPWLRLMGSCVSSLWPKQLQSQKPKNWSNYCLSFRIMWPESMQAQNNQHIIPLHLLDLWICVQFKYSEVKILKLTNCVLRFLLYVLYGPSVAPGGPLWQFRLLFGT